MRTQRARRLWSLPSFLVARARAAMRGEQGVALVTVIGAMMIMGVVVTTVLAATSSTVKSTTMTRSDVQSKAAAEAGIAYVRAAITAGTCSDTGGVVSSPAGMPKFRATIYWEATGTATTSSTNRGCPAAAATSVLVRSVGTADSAGIGDPHNNTNAVDALFTYAVVPAFNLNKALFTGQNMTLNNLAKVLRDSSAPNVPADVYAGGREYTCNANSYVDGSVYVKGGDNPVAGWFKNENGSCTITGDIVANTSVYCYGGMTVGGDVYTQRNLEFQNSGCIVGKKGAVTIPGKGNVGVGLAMLSTGGYVATGDVRVNGNYKQSNSSVTVGGKIYVRGTATVHNGWLTSNPGKLVATSVPAVIPPVPTETFPELDDAWLNANFAGWARPGWETTFNAVRTANSVDVCKPGGDGQMGTLEITVNTVLDARTDCGNNVAIGGGMTIKLKANVAIIGKYLNKNASLRIISGDSNEHEAYFIEPWTPTTTCDSQGGMTWGNGGSHTQPDGRTRVFIYAPRGFKTENPNKFRGQIYGCHATFKTDQEITYAPVSGLSGGTPGAGAGLTMVYQKDAS